MFFYSPQKIPRWLRGGGAPSMKVEGGISSKGNSDGRGNVGDDVDNCGSWDSDGDDDGSDAINDEDNNHDDDDTSVAAVRASGATKALRTIKSHHNSTAGEKNWCFYFPQKKPKMFAGRWCPIHEGWGFVVVPIVSTCKQNIHIPNILLHLHT